MIKRALLLALVGTSLLTPTPLRAAGAPLPEPTTASLDAEVLQGLTRSSIKGLTHKNLGAWDKAVVYTNGCHAYWGTVTPKVCVFGDKTSPKTVVLSGDSHAAALQPALDEWGRQRGWKLVTVTKAGCPLVWVSVIKQEESVKNKGVPYPECDAWRPLAIKRINELKPDVVVLPLLTRRGIIARDSLKAWGLGIDKTVRALSGAGRVEVLGDDPFVGFDVPSCLRRNPSKVQRCTVPYSTAYKPERIGVQRKAALSAGARFTDITSWFCTTAGCPATIGTLVVRRDDNHFSAALARHIWVRFDAVVQPTRGR